MKKPEELVAEIEKRQKEGLVFDFFPEILLDYLKFDECKHLLTLKEDVTEEEARTEWDRNVHPLNEDTVKAHMACYMAEYGWDKALNHRGLSAGRTIQKMQAFTWLLGDQEGIDWDNYENYGAPILKQICEKFGLPIPDSQKALNMAAGKPCVPDCEMGCGR